MSMFHLSARKQISVTDSFRFYTIFYNVRILRIFKTYQILQKDIYSGEIYFDVIFVLIHAYWTLNSSVSSLGLHPLFLY